MSEYSSTAHQEVINQVNNIVNTVQISDYKREILAEDVKKKMLANEEWTQLSLENSLVEGRAKAFAAIHELVTGYGEGIPISGAFVFSSLRTCRVFAEGSTVDSNLESFDRLMENVAYNDEKKIKEFKSVLGTIKELVTPYLINWSKQNKLSRELELSTWRDFKENGIKKSNQRPRRK